MQMNVVLILNGRLFAKKSLKSKFLIFHKSSELTIFTNISNDISNNLNNSSKFKSKINYANEDYKSIVIEFTNLSNLTL